jgi:hypothetical protein
MNHLESLLPGNTDVNDAGLETIKGLTHLQNLSLWETKVTDAGVEDLQKALPNCESIH